MLRRIEDSLLRAYMRSQRNGVIKDWRIKDKDTIKITNEMDEGQNIPYGSFASNS